MYHFQGINAILRFFHKAISHHREQGHSANISHLLTFCFNFTQGI
ncbi:MAG: hypothetical protein WCG25_08895 [bacterium]